MENQTIQSAQNALRNAPSGVYFQQGSKEPVKTFYSTSRTGVADVLEQAANEGYQALFIPELALAKSESPELWKNWFVTPSIRATGRTKQGTPIVIYAHVPNFYSDPKNIRDAIKGNKLVNGAGPIPQEAFNSLESKNGNGRVFVVDYNTLKNSSSGVIAVDDALVHPQTIPFLGGEDTAKRYLAKHKEVYGNKIGVWHYDDLKDQPLGRMLCVGDDDGGLSGNVDLGDYGRVFGVAPEAQSVVQKNSVPVTLESKVELIHNGKALRHEGKTYILAPDGLEL